MDAVSPIKRSEIMRSVKGKNTSPELAVRRILHALGYRYRLHRRDLPGTPDIVFIARKKAVFVNGCFWHGHGCKYGKLPKSRVEYWRDKIEKNKKRDRHCLQKLRQLGWKAIIVWQCELKDPEAVSRRLVKFLGPSRFVR